MVDISSFENIVISRILGYISAATPWREWSPVDRDIFALAAMPDSELFEKGETDDQYRARLILRLVFNTRGRRVPRAVKETYASISPERHSLYSPYVTVLRRRLSEISPFDFSPHRLPARNYCIS